MSYVLSFFFGGGSGVAFEAVINRPGGTSAAGLTFAETRSGLLASSVNFCRVLPFAVNTVRPGCRRRRDVAAVVEVAVPIAQFVTVPLDRHLHLVPFVVEL